ncbi:MAG TPA: hypothetical protein VD710_00590 [Nitrososphaeraceae archaeon]|nr:hypothetical protein [Nitrososphaeraceae archaeon]
MPVDSRKTQRKKRERRDRYKKGVTRHVSKRFKTDEYEDTEIQTELRKGNIVRDIRFRVLNHKIDGS